MKTRFCNISSIRQNDRVCSFEEVKFSTASLESFTSPQESDSQDSQDNSNNNEYSADEENDDPINQTFTISDDESESRNLFNKENSPRFLNRPVVDSKARRFSAGLI